MKEKEFMRANKRSIKIRFDDLKVFLRFPKETTMIQRHTMINALRAFDLVFLPDGWEVIVIRKDGTVEKL